MAFPPDFQGIINGSNPLATIGGGVSVVAAAETPITVAPGAGLRSYLMRLEAIATAAATAAGIWTLRDKAGGATLLLLQQPVTLAAIGTRYIWDFPHPFRTDGANEQFVIEPDAATLGTWIFIANGFNAAV